MSSTEAPTPAPELNQINNAVRGFGLFLMGVILLAILYCAIWVFCHRQEHIVKVHQPPFLIAICTGLFIWALAVLPMSMDDAILSQRGCSRACMATQWLLIMGYTICFGALYSKLFRINKLFHNPQFRRIKVEAKDVIVPFLALFSINFSLLLAWTLVSPLQWERKPIGDEEWNTFGSCITSGVGEFFEAATALINFIALILVCRQAWKARGISDEFNESRYLGIGLYNWFQLQVIGVPIEIVIGNENPSATYFLRASFALAECFSMLLLIFVPMFLYFRKHRLAQRSSTTSSTLPSGRVRVYGLDTDPAADASPREIVISRLTNTTTSAVEEVPSHAGRSDAAELSDIQQQLEETVTALNETKQRYADLEQRNKELEELLKKEKD